MTLFTVCAFGAVITRGLFLRTSNTELNADTAIAQETAVARTSSISSTRKVRVVDNSRSKLAVDMILNSASSTTSDSPKLVGSTTAASASTSLTKTTTPIPVFVGVLTAPTNIMRRDTWRLQCAPVLRAAGIDALFYIGRPSIGDKRSGSHTQGEIATDAEQKAAKQLHEEAEKYKDIVFLPFRDSYRDLVDKTVHIFDKGYLSGAQLIVKTDDDLCVDPKLLLHVAASHTYNASHRMLYGGRYLWKGTELKIMRGPQNATAPYFGGSTYVLSRNLVEAILKDNAFMNLHAMYGSSSEDTDVGKWVQHVGKQHPEYTIDFKTFEIGHYVKKLRYLQLITP
eukprot:GEMP01049414.1.p1 GENE.GEMP01049414.1~~GEMP01049414.1.p1  ORF type:complete len:340 (+),score=57.98 GEMP01049414.1:309-1328(+)